MIHPIEQRVHWLQFQKVKVFRLQQTEILKQIIQFVEWDIFC